MEWEQLRELVILGVLSLARGDTPDASSPFQFGTPSCPSVPVPVPDWCHLRVGGLAVAAVLSVLGVVVQWEVQVPEQGQLKPGDIWGHSGTIWGHSGTFGVIGGFGDVGG
ncbi:uncharacterized protein [Taeniopygia guttata]|uniref:uncharacterized protein isoform X3 n=1 Tax=Taeniopygia guttata TaxID=59729 RepID=UPI003BB94FE6